MTSDTVDADAPDAVARATILLDQGGLVAYPAGGRYALGADALDEDAVAAARRATRRPPDAPVSVVVPDLESARHLAVVTPAARRLADVLPGPLAVLLPVAMTAPANLADAEGRVAVRVPAEPFARRLAAHFGPVTAPRATRGGDGARPRSVADVTADGVALAVDAGAFADAPGATVVDATGPVAKVLKAGALPADALRQEGP